MARTQGPRNNKYVIHYDFSDTDLDVAIAQFTDLCKDLSRVGLQIEVRPGDDESLLIIAKAPKAVLRAAVYNLRVKDWLHGVTSASPDVKAASHGIDGDHEAEDLLSMYHLVNWPKGSGGAAITPGFNKWKDVKSIFPIHNDPANTALLGHLSKRILLSNEDLDRIRDLFGSKVAFYFAYMQTYLVFLTFPAVTGIYAWLFLPKYSLIYALITLVGCTVFLEYWKIQQADLSIRWHVRGVGQSKVNRAKFTYDRTWVDEAGNTQHEFSRLKYIARQMVQVPFFLIALLCLGIIITCVFAIEVLISEVYEGAYKDYLQYLPTILLAVSMPYLNSFLEDVAVSLAEYENHRTQDDYEMSLSQKMFVLSFIGNYLPIFLTAFVYIPMGETIYPYLKVLLRKILGPTLGQHLDKTSFQRDPDRLRSEVIALTVTGQLSDMFEELILPYIMHRSRSWYREYQVRRSYTTSFEGLSPDVPGERNFLQNVRRQASLPGYDVQGDISEMVIQFGYLALFSPVWPLISIGFLINNWIELRSDFLKICIEHQRPHPTRTDGIGPWIASLETLTLLGSISTGAIVHMFGASLSDGKGPWNILTHLTGGFSWWTLPVTIFVSEHIFLTLRGVVRFLLRGVGSDLVRQERKDKYNRRKKYWDNMVGVKKPVPVLTEEASDVETEPETDPDLFTLGKADANQSSEAGARLIRSLKQARKYTGRIKKE